MDDTQSGRRPFALVASVQKVVLDLLLGYLFWRCVVKVDQLPERARIAQLCAFAHTGELKGLNRLLVIAFQFDRQDRLGSGEFDFLWFTFYLGLIKRGLP